MWTLSKSVHTCVWGSVLVSATCVSWCRSSIFVSALFMFCLCVSLCVASLCFILPPGVQCSLAILKVRDDTVGEGSVITATSPSPPLSITPSLHLSFHVFSSLSCVALGMWTLLNFPPGGWRRRQEGIRGVIPSLLLSSVSPLSLPRGDSGRRVHAVKR